MSETIAWLLEDTRPPQPLYAAVNEDGMWYGEWNANNPHVVRFADKASAEAVMRACHHHDRGVIPFFHDRYEAREHMWVPAPASLESARDPFAIDPTPGAEGGER